MNDSHDPETEPALPSMTETVDVDVDQATAFDVFTHEFDHWWGNGPIDAWDSSRVIEHRFEPGPSGRLVEVYPDGELELGRIVIWDPPSRVAWTSSVDDVRTEVTFEALGEGATRVTVVGTATSPNAGEGFSFVTMTPQWLPRYLDRRAAGRVRPELGPLNIVLRYRTPAATARWLRDAFGFESTGDIPAEEPTDPNHTWIELRVGSGEGAVILWGLEGGPEASAHWPARSTDHVPWVFVDDLGAHFAHARGSGVEIVAPITQHGYRSYTAADCEGRHWLFAQAPPPRH